MAELIYQRLDGEAVAELSRLNDEPGWLTDLRLKSLGSFLRLPPETSELYKKNTFLMGLDLSGVDLFPRDLPVSGEAKALVSELAKLATGINLFYVNGQLVRSDIPQEVRDIRVKYGSLMEALRGNAEYFKPYFIEKAIKPEEDKIAALGHAIFSSGTYLYVPRGLEVSTPFRNINIIDGRGFGVFSYTLIIVDEGSKITFYDEGFSAGSSNDSDRPSVYGNIVEVYLKPGAEVMYFGFQCFGPNVIYFSNKRSIGHRDTRIVWVQGHFGGNLARLKLDTVMRGEGAVGQDFEVAVGNKGQSFDATLNLIHEGANTTGQVKANAVVLDSSKAILKGLIKIGERAKNSNSYLAEHAMILSEDATATTIPGLEIANNEVRATHSSHVAQVGEEQLFYLMSRGLDEQTTKRVLIRGFFEPSIRQVDSPEVRGRLRALIALKLARGDLMEALKDEVIEGYLQEEGEQPIRRDIFEGHYKYR